jgi:hypothetical protein
MLCRQSNISPRNIGMAAAWVAEGDTEVATLAQLVVDVGRIHPRKRKRLPIIRRNYPELWNRMIAAGVVEDWSCESPPPEAWFEPAREVEEPVSDVAVQDSTDQDEEIPF